MKIFLAGAIATVFIMGASSASADQQCSTAAGNVLCTGQTPFCAYPDTGYWELGSGKCQDTEPRYTNRSAARPTSSSAFGGFISTLANFIKPKAEPIAPAYGPAVRLRPVTATNPAAIPCNSAPRLDCAAPKKETWKKDASGNLYAVCEEPAPRTSAICYWDWKNEPQGPPRDWKCNDTPN